MDLSVFEIPSMLNYILEASIDDFIHSVERQNIALEVDASGARDGTDDPSYNGALIVSGDEKVCWSLVQNVPPSVKR